MGKKKSAKTSTIKEGKEESVVEEKHPSSAAKKKSAKTSAIKEVKEESVVEQKQPSSATKKKSAKTSAIKEGKEESIVEKKQSSSATKKASTEIDEIFAGKKRKRPEEKAEKPNGNEGIKPKSTKKDKSKRIKEGGSIHRSKPRRKTNDGLTIYSEAELGINKSDAGGTPLCPFDCECCF